MTSSKPFTGRFHVESYYDGLWLTEDSFPTRARAIRYIRNSKFWDAIPRRIRVHAE